MKRSQTSLWLKIFLGISLVSGNVGLVQTEPAMAQSFFDRLRNIFGPQRGAPPGRRRGGAVRDPDLCPRLGQNEPGLTAIVPPTNEAIRTTYESPMFWFYMPYPVGEGDDTQYAMEFVLQTADYGDVYEAAFTLPEGTSPGILGLRPKLDANTLNVGEIYNWYFLIYCDDPTGIYEPAFVQGTVLREPPSSAVVLDPNPSDGLTASDYLLAQADAQLWLDMLTTIHVLFPNNPTATNEWLSILESIDLEPEIQNAPLSGRFCIPDTESSDCTDVLGHSPVIHQLGAR